MVLFASLSSMFEVVIQGECNVISIVIFQINCNEEQSFVVNVMMIIYMISYLMVDHWGLVFMMSPIADFYCIFQLAVDL